VAAAHAPAVAGQLTNHGELAHRSIGGTHVQTRPRPDRRSHAGATHLAGTTTLAHAQATDQQATRRAPTEGQVGESWRHRKAASPEQAAADATLARVLAREHLSIPNQTPAQVPAPAPPQPSGQPDWLLAALAVLSAVLAVVAGLAMVAARRANRRARVGPAT
jgi:CHASE1-domain containing sensor protein